MVKIMENPIKMDDLGVPPFKETHIYVYNTYLKCELLDVGVVVVKPSRLHRQRSKGPSKKRSHRDL